MIPRPGGEIKGRGSAAYALHGSNTSNNGNSVAVLGHSDDGSGNLGPGIGVQGESAGGYGVVGTATTGFGVVGASTSASAVSGSSITGDCVVGGTNGATAYGVHGINTSNNANSVAVFGYSDDGRGNPGPGIGVRGETASGTGVVGSATSGTGIQGTATTGVAVVASSTSGDGLQATGGGGLAVAVRATGGGGVGVYGTSTGGAGTQAVYAIGTSGTAGLRATSDTGNGMVALSTSGTGLNVQSSTGSAVIATSNGVGYGLYLTAPSGWALGCVGRIRVLGAPVGTVTLKAGTTSSQVTSTACSGASQVILTPTLDPQVRVWAIASPGYFTLHASGAPSTDVTFSYVLIN